VDRFGRSLFAVRLQAPERDIASHGASSVRFFSFLKNGTGHRFLGITIFVEHFPEAQSISPGI
jgi:hypothetical protein